MASNQVKLRTQHLHLVARKNDLFILTTRPLTIHENDEQQQQDECSNNCLKDSIDYDLRALITGPRSQFNNLPPSRRSRQNSTCNVRYAS